MQQKNISILSSFGICLVTLLLAGCGTTQAERNVNAEVQKQSDVRTPSQVNDQTREEILHSQALNEQQKHDFLKLIEQTKNQTDVLKAENSRIKAALFEEFAQGRYNSKEISVYKNKLLKVDKEKRRLVFDSIEEGRKILGAQANNQAVLQMYREHFEW